LALRHLVAKAALLAVAILAGVMLAGALLALSVLPGVFDLS
jgi:hypothetical protein